jgi:hypothetical protein
MAMNSTAMDNIKNTDTSSTKDNHKKQNINYL